MTDDLKITFGKNIKKYRSLNNETSKELAETIGVSQCYRQKKINLTHS